MPQPVINGVGIAGIRNPAALDSDSAAFITAATITNETQKTAVNDLVVDLKAAGLWTKMKAFYPMVGGTAASHKWNLKDPRDLDAAFRLNFIGGWTHSSTGAKPNGTDGYANTNFNPTANSLTSQNWHVGYYSRTNVNNGGNLFGGYNITHGPILNTAGQFYLDWPGFNNASAPAPGRISDLTLNTTTNAMFIFNATSSNVKVFKNTSTLKMTSSVSTGVPNQNIFLNLGYTSNVARFDNRECAFASIGNGLTDLESSLLYQIVEKFQAVLSRNVNASRSFYFSKNYSNEVNAFVFNAAITNATQILATSTLVNTLKTAGIWTKMKAVYPMVGGTATSHKFNLVNPSDATSAYALAFNGGWTHNSLGAKPNGSNGYANTFLTTPSTQFSSASIHMSYYNVTNSAGGTVYPNAKTEIGAGSTNRFASLYVGSGANLVAGGGLGGNVSAGVELGSGADPRGYVVVSRTTSSLLKSYKNGSLLATTTTSSSGLPTTGDFNIGVNYFSDGTTQRNNWSDRQAAMITFGEGLTDAEVTTLTNAVQAFQTSLGRAV